MILQSFTLAAFSLCLKIALVALFSPSTIFCSLSNTISLPFSTPDSHSSVVFFSPPPAPAVSPHLHESFTLCTFPSNSE